MFFLYSISKFSSRFNIFLLISSALKIQFTENIEFVSLIPHNRMFRTFGRQSKLDNMVAFTCILITEKEWLRTPVVLILIIISCFVTINHFECMSACRTEAMWCSVDPQCVMGVMCNYWGRENDHFLCGETFKSESLDNWMECAFVDAGCLELDAPSDANSAECKVRHQVHRV